MPVRREIYDSAQLRMHSYPDITIDINDPLQIRDYIPKIIEDGFYGGVRN